VEDIKNFVCRWFKQQTSTTTTSAKPETTPKDLGISADQSSKWQQLASVSAEEFERAISRDGPKSTTESIINANTLRKSPHPQMDDDASRLWGRLRDFQHRTMLDKDPRVLPAGNRRPSRLLEGS
jgi:hypothetical protein